MCMYIVYVRYPFLAMYTHQVNFSSLPKYSLLGLHFHSWVFSNLTVDERSYEWYSNHTCQCLAHWPNHVPTYILGWKEVIIRLSTLYCSWMRVYMMANIGGRNRYGTRTNKPWITREYMNKYGYHAILKHYLQSDYRNSEYLFWSHSHFFKFY